MAENNASDVRLDANSNGTVYFAADVVATIAGLAVTEVEGVANTVGGSSGLADIFARRGQSNSRNLTRGVKVEVANQEVSVDVTIIVEYGSPVPEVAGGIQGNVKKAIETMTGMSVKNVDVHVVGVSFERENRAVAELEMRQRKLLDKQDEPTPMPAPSEGKNEERAEEASSEDDGDTDSQPEEDDDFELTLEDVDIEEEEEAPNGDIAPEAAAERAANENYENTEEETKDKKEG